MHEAGPVVIHLAFRNVVGEKERGHRQRQKLGSISIQHSEIEHDFQLARSGVSFFQGLRYYVISQHAFLSAYLVGFALTKG